jgi:peptidoglycan/xylan/chitin deacetylase (PgdA/CDA1 family)
MTRQIEIKRGQRRRSSRVAGAMPAAVLALAVLGVTGVGVWAQSMPQQVGAPPQSNVVAAPSTAAVSRAAKPTVKRAPAAVANGCGSEGAIGVARTQTIDTSSGPRYGHQQYKDIDFLADGEVVLTFDDGPLRPYTMPVLKALDAHCTKATFFVVGRMALSDPALVKETAKRGHTIGTHTYSHMDLRKTAASRARGEMELGFSAVTKALGAPTAPFFRFPYLSAPKGMLDYARSRRFGVFSIEVDANDYRTKDPAVVHRNVLSQLSEAKKGIILFHDIQASTAGALKGLLDELKVRGFKVVHLQASAPVATLPEFDAMAVKEMNRKSTIATADPLASRSVVWPVSAGPQPGSAAADGEELLPWGVKAVRSQPISPPPAPVARAKPAPEDDDWLAKLFKF